MKNQFIKTVGTVGMCLLLLGCSDESLLFNEDNKGNLILKEEVVSVNDEEMTEEEEKRKEQEIPAEESKVPMQETAEDRKEVQIAVHICGAVKQPGVYYLKPEQRIYEGIQAAGGFREDADSEYLNQAAMLEDGMKIVVPTLEETKNLKAAEGGENLLQIGVVSKQQSTKESVNGKVNLNTADEAALCTLPGIGESRAKSIIAYRKEHGLFEKIEDIMKVSGIKEAAFEKIKDAIMVSN